MSFREKTAWISLVLIVTVFGIYFTAVWLEMTGHLDHAKTFFLFFELMFAFAVLQVVLRVVVSRRAPLDAKVPADERENLIGLKADRVFGYLLGVGVFIAISTLHLGAGRIELAHAMLLAFAISQLVRQATVIVLHRRDA